MDCTDAQQRIVREPRDPAASVRRHLATCEQCRAFRQDCERLVDTRLLEEPPSELDAAILQRARERPAASPEARPSLLVTSRPWWLAVAAGLVLACVLWYPPLRERSEAIPDGGRTAQSANPALPWKDSDIDCDLMALEAELLLLDPSQVTALQPETSSPSNGEEPTQRRSRSIDDAIRELDTDLLFESEGLHAEPPLSAAPPSLARRVS